ncbi:sugar ABC transporter substrate-binding protein [Actinocorallia populi]|uniref:sugar ABC transporter substrate-binding protein n=1 Tax=Actinocorallia populi TaxID=2079200 RepID=UPI000D08B58D|nr:sugar ABC transporter substrate-binding protein [Actinocorallia populi]
MPSARLRPLGVLAAVAGCLVLGACGSAGAGDGPVRLGFVNGANAEFHSCLLKSVTREAKAAGAALFTANSHQDPGAELANIQDMLSRKVDALIVQTVDVDRLKDGIARAKGAGVPVFLTSVAPADPGDVLGAAVVDLRRVGGLDAEWVAGDARGRKAEAGVIAGAPGAASDLLVSGFREALPGNVRLAAEQPGMFNRVKAREAAEKMIKDHPGLDYVFAANEEMAFGALDAFRAAKAKVEIVTVNGTAEGLAAVKDGRFAATVANSPTTTGQLAVRNTLALLRGGPADRIAQVPVRLITSENLAEAPQYCLD